MKIVMCCGSAVRMGIMLREVCRGIRIGNPHTHTERVGDTVKELDGYGVSQRN